MWYQSKITANIVILANKIAKNIISTCNALHEIYEHNTCEVFNKIYSDVRKFFKLPETTKFYADKMACNDKTSQHWPIKIFSLWLYKKHTQLFF